VSRVRSAAWRWRTAAPAGDWRASSGSSPPAVGVLGAKQRPAKCPCAPRVTPVLPMAKYPIRIAFLQYH
jgi:hypothetical protein